MFIAVRLRVSLVFPVNMKKRELRDTDVNVHSEFVICVYKIFSLLFLSVHVYRCVFSFVCIFCVFVCTDVYPSWCVNTCVHVFLPYACSEWLEFAF